MAKIILFNLGERGVYGRLDAKPFRVPPQGFTNSDNMRFDGDRARSMPGNSPLTGILAGYTSRWIKLVQETNRTWVVYSDLGTIRAFDGTVDFDLTKLSTTYSVNDRKLWDYTLFETVPIFNPRNGTPQVWAPATSGTRLTDLPNWPANTTAEIIRSFKNRLLAFNLVENGAPFRNKILSSHTATPGTLPSSWDVSDPTKDTIEFSLNSPRDFGIVGAEELSGRMYVYTPFSIHQLVFRGGKLIFDNSEVLSDAGLYATNSLVTIPTDQGARHFYRGESDCFVFDGTRAKPILEGQFRKSLNAAINENNADRIFSVVYPKFNEVWLCYPEVGNDLPNKALIYNYRKESIGLKDLADTGVQSMTGGRLSLITTDQGTPFGDGSRFSDNYGFDTEELATSTTNEQTGLIEAVPGEQKLYLDGVGQLYYQNVNRQSCLERDGLIYSSVNQVGELVAEYERRLLWGRVWPKVGKSDVLVQFGSKEDEEDPVTWRAEQLFSSGRRYIDPPGSVSGRILAIRFRSVIGGSFDLSGFSYEVRTLGI